MNLAELEDFELAFIFHYKIDSYMPKTKGMILKEIKKRGLSESSLNSLRTEKELEGYVTTDKCCPRCKSFNFSYFEENYFNSSGIYNIGNEKVSGVYTAKICNICGFDLRRSYKVPTKNKGLLHSVLSFFWKK